MCGNWMYLSPALSIRLMGLQIRIRFESALLLSKRPFFPHPNLAQMGENVSRVLSLVERTWR